MNPLNQYTNVGGVSHAYDLTGNLDDDGPDAYAYDPENRLKWSTRDEGQPGSVTVQLRYDGRGRLRRRHDGGFGTTEYVYAGDAMIAEMSGSTVLRRYIHGPGIDDLVIWYEGSGTGDRRFLHADERGSIVAVTDNAGGVIARNTYDEWGVPAAANIGRFQYTGQQWLPEIGLHYYKARFYNPALGRFMQTDPIGYEDGMNLYAYVGNDPLNIGDPSGMAPAWVCKGSCDSALQGMEAFSELSLLSGSQPWRPSSGPVTPSGDVATAYAMQGSEGGNGERPGIGHNQGPPLEEESFLGQIGRAILGKIGGFIGLLVTPTAGGESSETIQALNRPSGVPSDWTQGFSRNGQLRWTQPGNTHNYVRIRRDGSITQVRNGRAVDVNGRLVPQRSPEAHYPSEQFRFRDFY